MKKCLKMEKSLKEHSKCAWEQSQKILHQAKSAIFYEYIPQKYNAKMIGTQKTAEQEYKPNLSLYTL